MPSETSIIALWPSDADFAADLGVPLSLVRVWKTRKSIPKREWAPIEDAAKRRGIKGATCTDLARLAKRPFRRQPALPVLAPA